MDAGLRDSLAGLVVVVTLWGHNKPSHGHPITYEILTNLLVIAVLVGNFLYSFGFVTPVLRRLWTALFPLMVLSFILGGIVSLYFDKSDVVTTRPFLP